MAQKYKCNKCGRIVRVQTVNDPKIMEHLLMCENPDQAPFPKICDGRLEPFEIKPAPCKDCE